MNLVRHELGFSKMESRFPTKSTCLAIYSRAVNAEAPLQDVLRANYPWVAQWEAQLRELFAGYVEAKQVQNVLDYDDLLLYWAQMVSDPILADDIGGRWDHVLVDEYQDTNRLQASILTALKPGGRGLTVVGDDAQSIYSFRAATVRNILDFPKEFSPPAEIITLDRNYRSTQPILAAANGVIDLARERFTKNLWTERESAERPRLVTVRDEADQARFVADEVLENREAGMQLKEQAVLFRASHHSGPLEVELTRRNIPFVKFGGLKFLDSAHVKDMLAALRFAQNPRDRVAGFRIMQLLPGVGPSSAQTALDAMADRPDPVTALAELPCPPRAAADWPGFVALLRDLRERGAGWSPHARHVAIGGAGRCAICTTSRRRATQCCSSPRRSTTRPAGTKSPSMSIRTHWLRSSASAKMGSGRSCAPPGACRRHRPISKATTIPASPTSVMSIPHIGVAGSGRPAAAWCRSPPSPNPTRRARCRVEGFQMRGLPRTRTGR
jgi:DNA helicase-2/ATP-dependent DNA helicase PcrA